MSAAAGTAPADGAGWEYVLLIPPGWSRLPLDPAGLRTTMRRLLDQRFARLPRDKVARLRRELELELRRTVDRAAEAGAIDLWVQTELIRGVAVSASLMVTVLDAVGTGGLAPVLEVVDAEIRTSELIRVGPDSAVRRLRVTAPGPDPAGDRGVLADMLPEATVVEYFFAVPDSRSLLLLSFSTATAQVADALVALFDAVAQSLEWRRAEPPNGRSPGQ